MNLNIQLRKISLSLYFKGISHYFWFDVPIDVAIIDQTNFTVYVFGGDLGNQQRPTLERIDMKLGRFN